MRKMTRKKKPERTSEWYVYLITDGRRTYVGSTTCVTRRLRQHNCELSGGARATRRSAGQWRIVCFVRGFADRKQACRWEALVKKRARGIGPRTTAMINICNGICPAGRVQYEVPIGLTLVREEIRNGNS